MTTRFTNNAHNTTYYVPNASCRVHVLLGELSSSRTVAQVVAAIVKWSNLCVVLGRLRRRHQRLAVDALRRLLGQRPEHDGPTVQLNLLGLDDVTKKRKRIFVAWNSFWVIALRRLNELNYATGVTNVITENCSFRDGWKQQFIWNLLKIKSSQAQRWVYEYKER